MGFRKVEIVDVESKKSKLTINPNTGRVTIKIGWGLAPHRGPHLDRFALAAENAQLPGDVTMRGCISKIGDEFKCILQSESKKFSYHLNVR